MEAHNGVSAKIVQEVGFKGIWASSLSISAASGVRDNNEMSWTQVLEVCELMADVTTIPILMDGDTGYGNFNSFRRLVRKLEQRGLAGVCIEDKIYPKTNSFIDSEKQQLADIDEFCGKIKSGKDSQKDPYFQIIARVEALIAGCNVEEALKRADAYVDSGADAILIHSKHPTAHEIELFMNAWDHRKPVLIVPTTYCKTPTKKFKELGVSVVIWANQTLRASVTFMQKILRQIHQEKSLVNAHKEIVSLNEIFRLQNIREYKKAEEKYLPEKKIRNGLILAESKGENFGSLNNNKPIAMIKIGDEPILLKIVKLYKSQNIKDISIVVGCKNETVDISNIRYIENTEYDVNGTLYSLFLARACFKGETIISFGDILFEEEILYRLINTKEDIVLTVDAAPIENGTLERDLVKAEEPYSEKYGSRNICKITEIKNVKNGLYSQEYDGEFIGLIKLSEKGAEIFKKELELMEKENFHCITKGSINDFLNFLVEKEYDVLLKYIRGQWQNIDSIDDLDHLISLSTE